MSEVRSDSTGIQPSLKDHHPTRQLRVGLEAPRKLVANGHNRPESAIEPQIPGRQNQLNGFQETEAVTKNTSYRQPESLGGEELATRRLELARARYDQAKMAHEDVSSNSPESFQTWVELYKAKTELGLAEIDVGSARIANPEPVPGRGDIPEDLYQAFQTISNGLI